MKLDIIIKVFCLDCLGRIMLIAIKLQFNVLLFSILAGIILGILYDLYSMLRGVMTSNRLFSFFEDILFGILSSFIIFFFLLETCKAYFEIYTFLYIALGTYCYIKLIRRYFIQFQEIIRCINKAIRIIFKVLLYPFQLIIYTFNIKIHRNNKK